MPESDEGEGSLPEDRDKEDRDEKEDWLKIRRLPELFGQALWEGDLRDMREDSER